MVDEVDDYERFKRAYMNEKFSPEILTFPFECFDNMMLYLEQRNDDIQQANDRQVKNGPLELVIEMEIERIRYLLKSFVRLRFQKIESHVLYYKRNFHMYEDRFSEEEKELIESLSEITDQYYKSSILNDLPHHFSNLEDHQLRKPRSNLMVICQVVEEPNMPIVIDGGPDMESFELSGGDILAISHDRIEKFVRQNLIKLI